MTTNNESLDVTLALTSIQGPDAKHRWVLRGRISHVHSRVTAEKALVGYEVTLKCEGRILPGLPLRIGVLAIAALPLVDVELALDQIGEDKVPTFEVKPLGLRALKEPCARVPLSLLRELRGQEATAEMSRKALVKVWADDRKTGGAMDDNS